MSTPAKQRELDALEQLALLADKAGLTLIEPAVTVNPVDNSYGDFELRADQRRR